jgi:hypothetical protein
LPPTTAAAAKIQHHHHDGGVAEPELGYWRATVERHAVENLIASGRHPAPTARNVPNGSAAFMPPRPDDRAPRRRARLEGRKKVTSVSRQPRKAPIMLAFRVAHAGPSMPRSVVGFADHASTPPPSAGRSATPAAGRQEEAGREADWHAGHRDDVAIGAESMTKSTIIAQPNAMH